MKYENWSLGYWLLKQYVQFINWLIIKSTIVIGKDKIPGNKPIVFAPNHQNALSDPMVVLLNTHLQPVWLARADIFGKNKVIDAILRFLKIVPVYRLRDGKENLDKNQETFAISIKVLENNSALALFPEAAHTFKRHMAPHKKAVPRIVFMAEEQGAYDLDIQIIPTGIYYSHYWKFNRSLIVNFGDPIPVADYLPAYRENPNAATIELKKRIHDALLPLTLNIRSKNYYDTYEKIRELYGNHFLKQQNKKITFLNRFYSDQQLVKSLYSIEKKHPEELQIIKDLTNKYYSLLNDHRIREWVTNKSVNHINKLVRNILLLLVSLPVFTFGFLLNAIPYYFIDQIVRKKIKDQAFWSSFILAASIIILPVYYLFLLLAMIPLAFSIWLKLTIVACLPFAGKLAFNWYILLRKTLGISRYLILKHFKRKEFETLHDSKKVLFEKLNTLIHLH